MCGICGIFGEERIDPGLLHSMADKIAHRGPDQEGFFVEGGAGLAVRRLSIIDLDGGQQPIASEDGQIIVVFNGEIYNYKELRNWLVSHGHSFRTKSDTECIVHLYETFGIEFVSKLRGMFAIAIFDRGRRKMVLARDRLGKKPLFYAILNRRLIFGSEIKPILRAAPELQKLNLRSVQPFFRYGFVPEPETAFEGIYKLPAGGILEFREGVSRVQRYWDLSFSGSHRENGNLSRHYRAYVDELDELLEEAIRIRLISDVPIGAFLSGGPDSSLIVAYMSRLMDTPVKTFTIAYDEATYDESADAERVANHLGTDHQFRTLSLKGLRQEFFETLDEIIRHTDEPFGDSSALPTYYVSKLARREVTVSLAGDGADEVFGGYTLYQGLSFASAYQRIPEWVRMRIISPLVDKWVENAPPGEVRWKADHWRKRLSDSNLPFREMLASKFSVTVAPLLFQLVPWADDVLEDDEISGLRWVSFGDATKPFEQTQYSNTRFHQLNDMLVKVDRMSMAHGLEVRSPYLDHRVVEFAASLPPNLKLRGFTTKVILRELAARYIPKQNAWKRKHGFGVPISSWFREPLFKEIHERLNNSRAVQEYLDKSIVSTILERHRSGTNDFGQLVWCLLAFDSWHKSYLEGNDL